MPRIIFTVINDLTYDQRMHRICSTLAKNGFQVLLVGRKLKTSIAFEPEPYEQQRMHLIFTKGKLFYLEYNLRLFFFLLFKSFDIVCGIDLDTILPCYFISKIRNKKIKNLFYAGQLTVPGPGVPPSIISGKLAAEQLQKHLNTISNEVAV